MLEDERSEGRRTDKQGARKSAVNTDEVMLHSCIRNNVYLFLYAKTNDSHLRMFASNDR